MRVGLHPDLAEEIRMESGALVVLATTHDFLSEAASLFAITVSSSTVEEASNLGSVPIESVVKALRTAIGQSLEPMRGATLSGIALRLDPTLKVRGWNGAGTFRYFIEQELSGVKFTPYPKPGFFYIPGIHNINEEEAGEESSELIEDSTH